MTNKASIDTPSDTLNTPKLTIVGIGASAGGLDALNELVSRLQTDLNAAFLIAMHLSPSHESQLVDILQHVSDLPVQPATRGTQLEAGKIYVTPPNVNLMLDGNALNLEPAAKGPYPKPSVDRLFRSLARHAGEQAIGIILSGTGSDGAAGIREIKQAGGITIVQDPETAKYDGMPLSAINTDCADLVTHSEKLADVLSSILNSPLRFDQKTPEQNDEDVLNLILRELKQVSGTDFSYIKPSTLLRRISRRIALHSDQSPESYLERLKKDKEETKQLASSILISVTSFFRDPDAFSALKDQIEKLVKNKTSEDSLRIWVPACATGEEAFTIAMLFYDLVDDIYNAPQLTIFASDMDKAAIEKARTGYYNHDSIANLPTGFSDKYFRRSGETYRIIDTLRKSVVFSIQNLMADPPFSKIDIISCRNFLIYLRNEHQQSVLEMFHYSLNPSGLLMLGLTESTSQRKGLFTEEEHSARIFKRIRHSGEYKSNLRSRLNMPFRPRKANDNNNAGHRQDMQSIAETLISKEMAPSWIIVDEHDLIKFLSPASRDLISAPIGPAVLRLHDVLKPETNLDLRGLMFRAKRANKTIYGTRTFLTLDGVRRSIAPTIIPMRGEASGLWLVIFHLAEVRDEENHIDGVVDSAQSGVDPSYVKELEQRLELTQQDLRSLSEELETSNEELQSQSEELQSSNEELQSMNEQLLTSNEELQSSNEELVTVNEELRNRTDELFEESARWQVVSRLMRETVLSFNANMQLQQTAGLNVNELLTKEHDPETSAWALSWTPTGKHIVERLKRFAEKGEDIEETIQLSTGEQAKLRLISVGDSHRPAGVVVVLTQT